MEEYPASAELNATATLAAGRGRKVECGGPVRRGASVLRNQSYSVIIVSPGFLGKVAEGRQFAGPEDPGVVDLGEIRMQSAT